MEAQNRVTVKIYGQTYTIAGDAPREYIVRIADYVNERMDSIAKQLGPGMATQVAVLSAVNIGEDYFKAALKRDEAISENKKLRDEKENYHKLWEDSKDGFLQHKQEIQEHIEQNKSLQAALEDARGLLEKTRAEDSRFFNEIKEENKLLKEEIERLSEEKIQLAGKVAAENEDWKLKYETEKEIWEKEMKVLEDLRTEMQLQIKAFADKEQEVETAFFDVQMENVHLKSELEKYKKER